MVNSDASFQAQPLNGPHWAAHSALPPVLSNNTVAIRLAEDGAAKQMTLDTCGKLIEQEKPLPAGRRAVALNSDCGAAGPR